MATSKSEPSTKKIKTPKIPKGEIDDLTVFQIAIHTGYRHRIFLLILVIVIQFTYFLLSHQTDAVRCIR